MARIQIPLDALTSRLGLGDRFASMRSGSLASRFSNLKPISEFFDVKRLSKPANFAEMQSRVNYNLGHFSSNYAVVFVMLCIYALLSNPWLLFDIVFVVAGMYLIGKLDGRDLEIGQHRFTTSQLYTGLYVIAIPIGLIASPFSTILWLIGASGVVILGHAALMDKPIDEAFSGEARVVEELYSDEESGTHGVGLASGALGKRFHSDPLRFTGVDLGDRADGARSRQRLAYQREGRGEDDDNSSEDDDSEMDSEREAELIESAMARIRRAQAKGKSEVKLNQDELAALERQRKRTEEGGERKRRKEKRIAVPISHLEPTSRKPPQLESADSNEGRQRQGNPPMGYFPPPAGASRPTRPRSGTNNSRPPSRATNPEREREDSPFAYSYVQPGGRAPSAVRHSSDTTTARKPDSRDPQHAQEEPWVPPLYAAETTAATSAPSMPTTSRRLQGQIDPFQYMMGGSPAPYHTGGPVPIRRPVPGSPSDLPYRNGSPSIPHSGSPLGGSPLVSGGGGGPSRRRSNEGAGEEDTASEESVSTGDERGEGARVSRVASSGSGGGVPPSGRGRPREVNVVTAEPPVEAEQPKKVSTSSKKTDESSKKKTGASGSGTSSRRRKGR
ncbi:COPII vesicles protein Yip3 [Diplogelasinospora grovesii]|uniref:COPII vesicles protein Yip3 n=1 Tax=Diplogelasinospora grovesii TaxID=303347 RepID=A0AAN6NB78_9PEZI|nr:COPII vesicles protein Yip3 [Diplogelasinospora grovesii]